METEIKEQWDAIEWLKKEARNLIRDYTDTMYNNTDVADMIKDMLGDIDLILKRGWQWVAIEECPMSVSNINVREATREEIQNATKR